jgi:hypothetical protein
MRSIGTFPLFAILFCIVSACGQDTEEIQKSLHIQKVGKTNYVVVPDSVRFHDTFSAHENQINAKTTDKFFEFILPNGWAEAPTSAFRQINVSFPDEAKATCYLTVLPLKGGDILLNLNRWRNQFDLPPLDQPDKEAEVTTLMGENAPIFKIDGNYTELSENGKNFTALCVLQNDKENAYSIKFIGPAEFVNNEKNNFISWVQSIKKIVAEPATPKDSTENSQAIYWATPKDWSIAEAKPTRLVTFQTKNGQECYITLAGGSALQNINRWRTQMNLPAIETLKQQELEVFKAPIGEVICLFLEGNYTGGMTDKPIENAIMAGALIMRPTNSIFIKMVDSKANILGEKDAFYQLIQSIRDTK